MSSYSDFLAQDFGLRCHELMKRFFPSSQEAEREVTFLLAIAAAGLIIPHERLSQRSDQPPLDRKRFALASDALDKLLAKRLIDVVQHQWKGGLLAKAEGSPDGWDELLEPANLEEQTSLSQVVTWLRNALAHGNIFTRPSAPHSIKEIVFVCGFPATHRKGKDQPLRFVLVSPDDLREFLELWFESLASLSISGYELGKRLCDLEVA
jgi:hypothetical protein